LRSRLLALALGPVVASGLAFAALTFSSARTGLEQAIGRQLADKARETAELLSAELGSAERALQALIAQDLMRELAIGDIDKRVAGALRATKQASPAFLDLLCTDAAGHLVASTNPAHLTGREALPQRAPQTPLGVHGPAPFGTGDGRALRIAAAVPDPDDARRTIGDCVLLYDWQAAHTLAARMRASLADVGERIDVLLLDESHELIGGAWEREPPADRVQRWRAFGASVSPRATPPSRGFRPAPSLDAVVGYAALSAGGRQWTVLAAQSNREALAPIARMQRRWAWTLGLIVLVAASTTVFLARRLVRPLLALTDATRSLAWEGAPPAPVPVPALDEVGDLAAAFNAMTAKLEQTREELLNAAKLAFLGEVAAGIAHEIRTPLSVIKTSTQVLRDSLPHPPPQAAELTQMMIEEVSRLERVVTGLLELARPAPPKFAPTALAPIARRAVELLEPQARERRITLRCDAADDAPQAWCDGEQIYQVLLNLAMNAIQVSPPGGVVAIRVGRDRDARARLEVSDQGPGIDPKVRDRLFTPFVTTRDGGTGLGLAVVDRIVRTHRGTVRVDSERGRGTTFTVWLPAKGAEP
jgi:signal transduction histidine kinase